MSAPTIYIIDDDEHTRILVEAHLKSLGNAVAFADANKAVEAIKNNGFPDLIITDIDMPSMSGLDLSQWVRDQKSFIPIIVISAFHSDENLFKALQMGATDFICKPFPLRNVRAAARHALKTTPPQGHITIDHSEQWVSFTFDSDHEYLRRVNSLISTLVEKRTTKDICNAIRLAIEEIGTNAIEWGNKNNPDLKVTIKYKLTPEKITLCIQDEGIGFSNDTLPESIVDSEELLKQRQSQGKRVGGYGINLVTQIMDKVVYSDSGNQIIMSCYLHRDHEENQNKAGEA